MKYNDFRFAKAQNLADGGLGGVMLGQMEGNNIVERKEMDRAMADQGAAVADLSSEIEHLLSRLSPVRGESKPESPAGESCSAYSAPLCAAIAGNTEHVRGLAYRIRAVLGELSI